MEEASQATGEEQAKWRPLNARQRRVLGVLVEKAKTTPDSYPLSLNGLTSGCNQKNNREPQTDYSTDEVEETLDELREMGAVAEVFGGGRVSKYRHYAKEWLGVTGGELAVMAELLLRGEQTVGELRGRAARMATEIRGVSDLQPLLDSLIRKRLVLPLSPAGRGQVVTHGLYPEREMHDLRRQFGAVAPTAESPSGVRGSAPTQVPAETGAKPAIAPAAAASGQAAEPAAASTAAKSVPADIIAEIRLDIAQLRVDLTRLKQQVEDLRKQNES